MENAFLIGQVQGVPPCFSLFSSVWTQFYHTEWTQWTWHLLGDHTRTALWTLCVQYMWLCLIRDGNIWTRLIFGVRNYYQGSDWWLGVRWIHCWSWGVCTWDTFSLIYQEGLQRRLFIWMLHLSCIVILLGLRVLPLLHSDITRTPSFTSPA